jgi:hypothetical protein
MTSVINLFGGPGIGKSTLAALLYGHLKSKGISVELVQETAKKWAYMNRIPGEYDPLFFLGKQSSSESLLYGKVDYVITDSPVLLAGIYQEYQSDGKNNYVTSCAEKFLRHTESNGIIHHNFVLQREGAYDNLGRFENSKQAMEIDELILRTLKDYKFHYEVLDGPKDTQQQKILQHLNL